MWGEDYKTETYSGMLNASESGLQTIHYIFLKAINQEEPNLPLVLWLNGGP